MFRNNKIILLVLALLTAPATNIANADFTFGTPVNLGPVVNTSASDVTPNTSTDGLSLFFSSDRPGGYGDRDIWVTTRATTNDDWGIPVNLGPTINSSSRDSAPSISVDGLSLFFDSVLPGGYGDTDIWVSTRPTLSDPWGEPENLGPIVNSPYRDSGPSISYDGLELYFGDIGVGPFRPGGYGGGDLWVTKRATTNDEWSDPVNLGPNVNTSTFDAAVNISADGLVLFFMSRRDGGYGGLDIWLTRRATKDDPWGIPVNLGPPVNTSDNDVHPSISADGSTFYFASNRSGGSGGSDLCQVSIEPIVDLNADRIVDSADMCIIVDNWGTDEPLCDIGPMPWGDGIVDVEDLIVLAEHLFEEVPSVE